MLGVFVVILMRFCIIMKRRERSRPEAQMEQFRKVLIDNGQFDLKYIDDKYTWNNKHCDNSFIEERLDRVIDNRLWKNLFDGVKVEILPAIISDHRPIVFFANNSIWRVVNKPF